MVCLKCGKHTKDLKCAACGFDFTRAERVVSLAPVKIVDPEALRLKKEKQQQALEKRRATIARKKEEAERQARWQKEEEERQARRQQELERRRPPPQSHRQNLQTYPVRMYTPQGTVSFLTQEEIIARGNCEFDYITGSWYERFPLSTSVYNQPQPTIHPLSVADKAILRDLTTQVSNMCEEVEKMIRDVQNVKKQKE